MAGAPLFSSSTQRTLSIPRMETESSIRRAIEQTGVITAVRSHAPIDSMIEVGDALLATPLTVLAISPGSCQPWQTLTELRSRFGANMHIGAGPLSTPAQVQTAIDAGTQFVLYASPALQVGVLCRRHSVLFLPAVATPAAVAQAERNGWTLQLLFPPGRNGTVALRRLHLACPTARLVPMGGVTLENLPAYARAGAAAAVVRGVLGGQTKWTMATLITQMRRVRAAWEAGLSVGSCG